MRWLENLICWTVGALIIVGVPLSVALLIGAFVFWTPPWALLFEPAFLRFCAVFVLWTWWAVFAINDG